MFGLSKKKKAKKLAEEKAAAEKAAAEKAAAEKAAAEKAAAEKAAEKAAAEKAAAEKAAAEKAAEKAAAEKAAAEKAAAEKAAAEKAAEKAAAEKAAAEKAAAKKAAPAKKEAPAKKAAPEKKAEPVKEADKPVEGEEITEEAVTAKGKFEIKRTSDRRYMFNVRAGNTQVIASSQIYSSMAACRNGIDSVGKNAPLAHIEDQTLSSINEEKCPKFQIYFDKAGKYRFNLLAANGQNILACTQGYTQKSSCKNGINSVINNAHSAIVLPNEDE